MPHYQGSWVERTNARSTSSADDLDRLPSTRQVFKHPHTSLGVAGHIVHMAGIFVPVLAGEFVESPQKYKKIVRVASIGTAAAYELLYSIREEKRRHEQEARLAECRIRCD
jgi:hypothetical protein